MSSYPFISVLRVACPPVKWRGITISHVWDVATRARSTPRGEWSTWRGGHPLSQSIDLTPKSPIRTLPTTRGKKSPQYPPVIVCFTRWTGRPLVQFHLSFSVLHHRGLNFARSLARSRVCCFDLSPTQRVHEGLWKRLASCIRLVASRISRHQ